MKLALIQLEVFAAKPEKNFKNMKKFIEMAISEGVELAIFPEMCLSGYFNGDRWEQTSFLKECVYYGEEVKKLSKNISLIFGNVGVDWEKKNEDGRARKYNAAFCAMDQSFVRNSKTDLCFWPKTLLPNYREFDDSRHFYDLRKLAYDMDCRVENIYEPILLNHNLSVGISICEDAWIENYSISPIELFHKKYQHDFFVNLSASPFTMGKQEKREKIFSNLSSKINLPIFYVNCVGTQNIGKTVFGFDGNSQAFGLKKLISPTYFQEKMEIISYG